MSYLCTLPLTFVWPRGIYSYVCFLLSYHIIKIIMSTRISFSKLDYQLVDQVLSSTLMKKQVAWTLLTVINTLST